MIKRQLEAFPAGLYKKRTEAMEFPTNIYYARMPNVVLMKFLSAMTIVICVESQNKKEAQDYLPATTTSEAVLSATKCTKNFG